MKQLNNNRKIKKNTGIWAVVCLLALCTVVQAAPRRQAPQQRRPSQSYHRPAPQPQRHSYHSSRRGPSKDVVNAAIIANTAVNVIDAFARWSVPQPTVVVQQQPVYVPQQRTTVVHHHQTTVQNNYGMTPVYTYTSW